MKPSSKISPAIGLSFGILAVSTASIFIRFAQQGAPSLVIAAGRLVIATLLLAPFALKGVIADSKRIDRKTWFLLLLSGVFLALHFATWITSLEYTSVASSVVLVSSAPLWVALLSPLFLKQQVSRGVVIGLTISLAGSLIVGLNGACQWSGGTINCVPLSFMMQGEAFIGDLLALAGALMAAGYLMIGSRVRNEFSLLSYAFIVYGFAGLVLLILAICSGLELVAYSGQTWMWISLLAFIPQLIGHSTYNYFLKFIPATVVSIALLGEPIGTVLLALLFLREPPTTLEIIGGVLILAGIVIAASRREQKDPE